MNIENCFAGSSKSAASVEDWTQLKSGCALIMPRGFWQAAAPVSQDWRKVCIFHKLGEMVIIIVQDLYYNLLLVDLRISLLM